MPIGVFSLGDWLPPLLGRTNVDFACAKHCLCVLPLSRMIFHLTMTKNFIFNDYFLVGLFWYFQVITFGSGISSIFENFTVKYSAVTALCLYLVDLGGFSLATIIQFYMLHMSNYFAATAAFIKKIKFWYHLNKYVTGCQS